MQLNIFKKNLKVGSNVSQTNDDGATKITRLQVPLVSLSSDEK